MNRDGIRDFAARELGLVTSKYRFAESREEADRGGRGGRAALRGEAGHVELGQGPEHRQEGGGCRCRLGLCRREHARRPPARDRRGIHQVRQRDHPARRSRPRTACCSARPIGHRQEAGDYRESWQPAGIPREALHSARFQARKVVEALGGHGIFGVEFFVRGDQAIFSELSPRPHDTGMVTLISQFPNEFELHLRAILGLPIPVDRADRPVGFGGHPRGSGERQISRYEGVARRARARLAAARRWTSGSSPSRRR